MNDYLANLLEDRRENPRDDLLTRLLHAEIDGEKLTQRDILNFFQALLVAGSETTTNLINNAILCFIENPDQLALLRRDWALLPSAIEEVLRYRSPLQWMFRVTTREVELHGQIIPTKSVVLAMIGSANRDARYFKEPDRFDIAREPNPHLAFSHGIHFCMGAPLARLEAKVALTDLLSRLKNLRRSTEQPWKPRSGLHVHGPASLRVRFEAGSIV
jgi:cytochrome P450